MRKISALIIAITLTGCVSSTDTHMESLGFPTPTTVQLGEDEWSVTHKPGEVRVYRRCVICKPDSMYYHDQAREAVRRVTGCEITELTTTLGVMYFGRLQCAPEPAPEAAS